MKLTYFQLIGVRNSLEELSKKELGIEAVVLINRNIDRMKAVTEEIAKTNIEVAKPFCNLVGGKINTGENGDFIFKSEMDRRNFNIKWNEIIGTTEANVNFLTKSYDELSTLFQGVPMTEQLIRSLVGTIFIEPEPETEVEPKTDKNV